MVFKLRKLNSFWWWSDDRSFFIFRHLIKTFLSNYFGAYLKTTYKKVSSQQHSTYYQLKICPISHSFLYNLFHAYMTMWFTVFHTNTKRWKDFVRRKQDMCVAVACGSMAIDAFHSLQTAQTQTKLIIKYKRTRNVRLLLQGRPVSERCWMGRWGTPPAARLYITHNRPEKSKSIVRRKLYEKTLTFVCSLCAWWKLKCMCVCQRRRLLFVFISWL